MLVHYGNIAGVFAQLIGGNHGSVFAQVSAQCTELYSNKLPRSNIHNLRSIAMGWTITGNYCMKVEKN